MTDIKCPVCDSPVKRADIPNLEIYNCPECKEVVQVGQGGSVLLIRELLQKGAMGDDRVRAATSAPHVVSVKSFVDLLDNNWRMLELGMAEAKGGLRTILAQLNNRLDLAISRFTGLDMVSEGAAQGLQALREAKELVSTGSSRNRGVPQEAVDADPPV